MRRVILQTWDGEHLHDALMAPHETNPEAVMWGTRVFVLYMNDPAEPIYREVFCAPVRTVED